MSTPWIQWLLSLVGHVDSTAHQLKHERKVAQQAAIVATPVPMPSLAAGLYRVSYYVRVTQAATTSSSVQVTIGWTDGGVNCSFTGQAKTGNTTTTLESQTLLIRSAQAAPITYAVAYTSVGATPMQFAIDVVVEALP